MALNKGIVDEIEKSAEVNMYVDNVIPILYYGGLDWIRMGGDHLERIVKKYW